eukprot:1057727-Pleurochrysis_carterae.AAC.4
MSRRGGGAWRGARELLGELPDAVNELEENGRVLLVGGRGVAAAVERGDGAHAQRELVAKG